LAAQLFDGAQGQNCLIHEEKQPEKTKKGDENEKMGEENQKGAKPPLAFWNRL